MNQLRRTKIIATLGPSTDQPDILFNLIQAGVDAVRLNFSHGTACMHQKRARYVREYAQKLNRPVALLADLQGPKIRISSFKTSSVYLAVNNSFILNTHLPAQQGDEHQVGLDYKALPHDVAPHDELLLDDGRILLRVEAVREGKIYCRVITGGILSDNKGINRKGGGLSATALTDKDYQDMVTAIALDCDYIAVSFPRSAEDMHEARDEIQRLNGNAGLIAKIERTDALSNLDAIIEASDGVMVARGDLAVEIGEAEVPAVQKRIIHRTRMLNKFVITATQMMESMIKSPVPTRAEVSDVANAVLDGTDAVMLSAETASGNHPHLVVEKMGEICKGAEKQPATRISKHRVDRTFKQCEEAIAMAAMYIGNHFAIKGIIAFTQTGMTPLWMSRIRSSLPIYGCTTHLKTYYRISLYRGVYPIHLDCTPLNTQHLQTIAINHLKNTTQLKPNDGVLVTYGKIGIPGGTNTLQLLTVS